MNIDDTDKIYVKSWLTEKMYAVLVVIGFPVFLLYRIFVGNFQLDDVYILVLWVLLFRFGSAFNGVEIYVDKLIISSINGKTEVMFKDVVWVYEIFVFYPPAVRLCYRDENGKIRTVTLSDRGTRVSLSQHEDPVVRERIAEIFSKGTLCLSIKECLNYAGVKAKKKFPLIPMVLFFGMVLSILYYSK